MPTTRAGCRSSSIDPRLALDCRIKLEMQPKGLVQVAHHRDRHSTQARGRSPRTTDQKAADRRIRGSSPRTTDQTVLPPSEFAHTPSVRVDLAPIGRDAPGLPAADGKRENSQPAEIPAGPDRFPQVTTKRPGRRQLPDDPGWRDLAVPAYGPTAWSRSARGGPAADRAVRPGPRCQRRGRPRSWSRWPGSASSSATCRPARWPPGSARSAR